MSPISYSYGKPLRIALAIHSSFSRPTFSILDTDTWLQFQRCNGFRNLHTVCYLPMNLWFESVIFSTLSTDICDSDTIEIDTSETSLHTSEMSVSDELEFLSVDLDTHLDTNYTLPRKTSDFYYFKLSSAELYLGTILELSLFPENKLLVENSRMYLARKSGFILKTYYRRYAISTRRLSPSILKAHNICKKKKLTTTKCLSILRTIRTPATTREETLYYRGIRYLYNKSVNLTTKP